MVILENWNDLKLGQRVNLVCQTVLLDCQGKHLVRILGHSELVVIYGDLEQTSQLWTILQAELVDGRHKMALRLDERSFVFPHEPTAVSSITNCVELCCGAGFLSVGMKAAGYNIVAGVEQNSRFGCLYHENGLGQFVHGSVGDAASIQSVLKAGGQNATVAAGVACQPYSRAGDGKGGADARASTLPQSLEFSWLLQSPIVILECTPRAMQDSYVQGLIKEFCTKAGYMLHQQILHLEKCWASNRARWWCILSARLIGEIKFDDLPVMPEFQKVKSIMPYEVRWPDDHLAELTLNLYEHSKFHRYSQGLQTMILDPEKQMGTALHAWGNQCYPCACGCRAGFSEQRMQQRGLFATFIASSDFIEREGYKYPVCRHMHPAEVALLCGAFPSLDWKGQLKLGLAAVGQMASPLQSCWIGAHVLVKLADLIQEPCVAPEAKLRALQKDLLQVRDAMWPPLVPQPTGAASAGSDIALQAFVCDYASGITVAFSFQQGQQIQHLIQAETALAFHPVEPGWVLNEDGVILDEGMQLEEGMIYQFGFGEVPVALIDDGYSRVELDLLLDFQGLPVEVNPPQEIQGKPTSNDDDVQVPSFKQDVQMNPPEQPVREVSLTGNPIEKVTSNDEPLCQLSVNGLLQMLPPHIETDSAMKGLFAQSLAVGDRQRILVAQQHAWADDELRFHLGLLAARAPSEQNVLVWDPIHTTSAVRYHHVPSSTILESSAMGVVTIVTVMCISQHWIPVLWRKDATSFLGFAANAPVQHRSAIQAFHSRLCTKFGVMESPIQFRELGSQLDSFCGVVAIEYLEHLLWGTSLVLSHEALSAKHAMYRNMFEESLQQDAYRPWIWGLGIPDQDSQLVAILREHGVETGEVQARIEMLKTKLGQDQVLKALQSHNPWRELKWMANQSVPPVQIIRPSELQSAIDARASQQTPVGSKKTKGGPKGQGKGKTASQPTSVDPQSLRLEDGIFVIEGTVPLSQIPLKAIGPLTQGVALVSLNEALPFLGSGKAVTEGGLGLIVLDMPVDIPKLPLISTKVVFPVICAANAEPMLIEGHLFQLGHKPVTKATGGSVVKLTSIDTCVAKFAVFRDQIQGKWDEFVQHPLKYLLHHVAILTACQQSTCDGKCGHWHKDADATIKDPILEVWNRQWMTLGYAHCSSQAAEIFSVAMRFPQDVEAVLQSFSGSHGIYIEPKAIDGRQVTSTYSVIWTPKATHAQAMMYLQTVPGIVGLARLGSKLGVRCLSADSFRVHEVIKPDTQFLPGGVKQSYLIGPVPWGTIKQSLNEAFRAMGWEARAVQAVPAGRAVEGVLWRVQSTQAPPEKIIKLDSGDAVITRVDIPTPQKTGGKVILGSAASKNFVHKSQGEDQKKGTAVDGIFVNDPWAKYQSTTPAEMPKTSCVPAQWAGLEQKVVDQVLARLPKESMEIDNDDQAARVDALEAQVKKLHDQQQQLHAAVQENHHTHQAQFGQLQSQFQAQHHRLETVVNEQSNHIAGLSNSFAQQLERQQGQLDQMFQAQMQKIEDLLAKKARHE